jgi:hypothetical protein
MFDPIASRADALKTIKDVSIGLLVLAAIQTLLLAFIMRSALVDTMVLAILASLLWWLKSRVVAILLLILSILEAIATVVTLVGIANLGGKNVWLATLYVWAAFKAVEATFKLHGKYAETDAAPNGAPVVSLDNSTASGSPPPAS